MPKNVEIKARLKDFEKAVNIARKLCGTDPQILNQEDTFFNCSTGRLKLRNFQDGSKSQLMHYNRPDIEDIKTSDYSICFIEDHQDLINVLKPALGVRGSVKKTRYLFLYGQTRIHIDKVEGLGDYFELEVVLASNQSVEEGEQIAKNLASEFGITKEDLLKGAYIDYLIKN